MSCRGTTPTNSFMMSTAARRRCVGCESIYTYITLIRLCVGCENIHVMSRDNAHELLDDALVWRRCLG